MIKLVLPPGAAPKALTANARTRSMLDRQLAFLNSNNKNGFKVTESLSDEQVCGLAVALLEMAEKSKVHMREISDLVMGTKKPDGHFVISYKTAAALLGYADQKSLKYYKDRDGFVINRRNTNTVRNGVFNGSLWISESDNLISAPRRKKIRQLIKQNNDKKLEQNCVSTCIHLLTRLEH